MLYSYQIVHLVVILASLNRFLEFDIFVFSVYIMNVQRCAKYMYCTTHDATTLNKNTLKRKRQIANPCRRYSHIQYSSFYSLCKCRNAETRANLIQGCHSQLWNRFGSLFRLTTREAGLSSKSIPLCTPI